MSRIGPTRRDFLKLIGASLGGVALSSCVAGCGGSGAGTTGAGTAGPSGPPLPSGYRFFQVFSPGDSGLGVSTLFPNLTLDESGRIHFYGQTAAQQQGLHVLQMEFGGTRPRVAAARTLVQGGQQVADGRIVTTLGNMDVNRRGEVAVVLNFQAGQGPTDKGPMAVFCERGQGLEPLVDFNDPVGGNNGEFGGDFGDLDLHGNDLLMVARYGGDGQNHQGLVYLPGMALSTSRVLLSSEQQIPNVDGSFNGFGLIDLDDDGDFVVQGFGSVPRPLQKATETELETVVLAGNVGDAQTRLLAVSPALQTTRAAALSNPAVGTSVYGPRLGANGVLCTITEAQDKSLTLYRNQLPIARTGQTSPGGVTVRSCMPAVISSSGLTFYELATDTGLELCLTNGVSQSLLLRRGDTVDGDVIDTLAFGFHSSQVDDQGRLVAYAQMRNGRESILVGIPV